MEESIIINVEETEVLILTWKCNNETSIYVEESISILYGMWKSE